MKDIEFRDGPKSVPDHVAAMLAKYETHQMTYEEARARMNMDLLSDRLGRIQSQVVSDHLARFGTE